VQYSNRGYGGCLGLWKQRLDQFTRVYNQTTLDAGGQLPDWVYISQRIPSDWMMERLLKTQLVYKSSEFETDFLWNLYNLSSFDEKRQHDPLVMIATRLFGPIPLDREQKIRVLEALYDSRHQGQERLWSGTDLRTSNVTTHIRLFPASRLAYMEQTLNNSQHPDRGLECTTGSHLYVPSTRRCRRHFLVALDQREGGKGVSDDQRQSGEGLQNDCRGRESENRDHSVVHWQEGNQVSVRVFPCTNLEERRVKIGITSPLRLEKDQLMYSSIYFDGPTAVGAFESVRVKSEGEAAELDLPPTFVRSGTGIYSREGDYWADWDVRIPLPASASQSFSFGGKTYQTEPYEPLLKPFSAQTYFLDITASWSTKEKEAVWESLKDKKVYVYDQGLVRLTEQNRLVYFDRLGELRYSLFPLHEIKEPATSLLITKSARQSPNLRDLKESAFSKKLLAYLQTRPRVRVYNLSSELSPYMKTLKEFRVLEYDEGDLDQLTGLLERRQFVYTPEDDQAVVIGHSGMRIRQTATVATGQAPDHLLRFLPTTRFSEKSGQITFATTG